MTPPRWIRGAAPAAGALLLALTGCVSAAPETPSAPPTSPASSASPSVPEQSAPRLRILLDPGHGGEDAGACRELLPEKTLNLLLAREIRRELVRRGFTVLMTRDCDLTLTLRQRQILADALRPDLLVSVHHNAAVQPDAAGIEYYIRTAEDDFPNKFFRPSSRRAADFIRQAVVARIPETPDRGVKQARFAVLIPKRPAVLLEAGFVSNPREALSIHTAERRRRFAEGVAEGILRYSALVPMSPGLPPEIAERSHHVR